MSAKSQNMFRTPIRAKLLKVGHFMSQTYEIKLRGVPQGTGEPLPNVQKLL